MSRLTKLVRTILGASLFASSIVSFILGTLMRDEELKPGVIAFLIIAMILSSSIIYFWAYKSFIYEKDKIDIKETESNISDVDNEKLIKEPENKNPVDNQESYGLRMYTNLMFDELVNKNILKPLGKYTIIINDKDNFIREISTMSKFEVNTFLEILKTNIRDENQYTNIKELVLKSVGCDLCIGVYDDLEKLFTSFIENNVYGLRIIQKDKVTKYHTIYQNDINQKYFCIDNTIQLLEPIKISGIESLILLEYAYSKGYILPIGYRFKFSFEFSRREMSDMREFYKTHFSQYTEMYDFYIEGFEKFLGVSMSDICREHEDRDYANFMQNNSDAWL